MAETADGKKHVYVHTYPKTSEGKKVIVPAHYRSNPTTSKGKKSSK